MSHKKKHKKNKKRQHENKSSKIDWNQALLDLAIGIILLILDNLISWLW